MISRLRVPSLLFAGLLGGCAETSAIAPVNSPQLEAYSHEVACEVQKVADQIDEEGAAKVAIYEVKLRGKDELKPLLFISDLKVNTDGTRKSYHPDDPRGKTLAVNKILNAMRRGQTIASFERVRDTGWPTPETWTVLLRNVIEADKETKKPCLNDDGYLVSMTADVAVAGGFGRKGDCDGSKWIDAGVVPALVLPGGETVFRSQGARLRSPVVAAPLAAQSRTVFGLVGDIGPEDELGEASIAMNAELNGLPAGSFPVNYDDAKERFVAPASAILVFPGRELRLSYPVTRQRVQEHSRQIFENWGGESRLAACVRAIEDQS
jgi:hypothetical protein